MSRTFNKIGLIFGLFCQLLLLAGCSNGTGAPSQVVESPTVVTPPPEAVLDPTFTPFSPSATPVELAAQVNGEGISLEEYQAERSRFRAASEAGIVTYAEDKVLEDLIDQVLLGQGASEAGFVVNEAILQDHILQLGIAEQDLQDWMTTYGYTEETFRQAMRRSIAAAWMSDQITAPVPATAEQVHARQILLYNSSEADQVFEQLETGADFETLAEQYDPVTQGDLGWFPRGYLTVPELDDVAFSLEPGAYSPIIQTALGFHIIQVIERQSERPLSPDAFRVLQTQAVQQWLAERRDQSEILIFLPK